MLVDHKGHFHKVGQGLFYSGEFIFKNSMSSRLNYVVDCGSADVSNKNGYNKIYKHALSLEVELYKKNIFAKKHNIIDIFVISHMHLDHINGLIELLKSEVKIDKLFLPYLEPVQSAIIVTAYLLEGSRYNSKNEYIEFIMNPINFLRRFSEQIGEIIFISESDEEPLNSNSRENIEQNENNITIEGNKNEVLNGEVNKYYSNVEVYKECFVNIREIFKFYFFRKKIHDASKVDNFKSEFAGVNIDSNYLKNYKNRRKLKSAYEKIFGKSRFNDTSLCVWMTYSQEPNEIKTSYKANNKFQNRRAFANLDTCYFHRFYKRCYPCSNYRIEERFGYIFPGDIDISLDADFNFFKSHCSTISNKIKIFCIQHHGSRHNWNSKLIDEFQDVLWVFSSGTNNSHKHPHKEVLKDISSYGHIIRVDEQQEFIQYTKFRFL